jgi:uncharacterized lipoprotein YmbA
VNHLILPLVGSLALAGGCGTPPTNFYTLSPVAEAKPAPSTMNYSVAVGAVSVPDLLDRPQLVLRRDANRVDILDQTRWAAPLQSSIGQVIAANLSYLLSGARVTAYPQNPTTADYQVGVDVLRFESAPGIAVSQEVLWTIRDTEGQLLRTGRSVVREAIATSDTEALVAAHDRALAAVSRDIASSLLKNPQPVRRD